MREIICGLLTVIIACELGPARVTPGSIGAGEPEGPEVSLTWGTCLEEPTLPWCHP